MYQNEDKKQYSAVIIGFGLIILVFIFTVYNPKSKNENVITEKETTQTNKENSQYAQITPADFKEKSRKDKNWLIIDIRQPKDFQNEHVLDSINMPSGEDTRKELSLEKNKNALVINYGQIDEEKINNVFLAQLKSQEFDNIFFLSGGFAAWKKEGGATISAGNQSSFTDQAKIDLISVEKLTDIFNNNEDIFLLDTRPAASFAAGHFKNAVNIPLADLEKRRSEISAMKEIIVYGEDANDSFQAGVRLYDLNFFAVSVLEKGFLDGKEKGLEIIK